VRLVVEALPDPASLGPYTTYVAWVLPPRLAPEYRLGEVRGGVVEGRVALDQFLVMVTAESSADVESPQVDLVVHHEGEQTIIALLDLVDRGAFHIDSFRHELGIAFCDSGTAVINPPRPPIDDLDTLPLPARDLIDMERYLDTWRDMNGYTSLTISTSRGCPYGCDWCTEAVHGREFRQRSPESVAAQMKQLKETYQIDRLRVVDDVDGLSREWLEEWVETAVALNADIPFEALYDLERKDIPMLDVRDSL
jgi:radical SAM superfamily enzyme YgiQ (UPF0313 family)